MEDTIPLNWHEDFIIHLAQLARPKIYVELGIYKGALFNRMIPYAERLIGVDIAQETVHYIRHSSKVRFINAKSSDFAYELQINPLRINMLFIDANHSKESVLEDFYNFFPFIAPHGIILLHDTHPAPEHLDPRYCDTAYQAVEELAKLNTGVEMVTIPVPPGLTICRKRQTQLSWQES
jgi:predicted O-methyltransferase YrrM